MKSCMFCTTSTSMTLSNATDILLLNILYITSLHKAIEINGFHAAADAADAAEAA